jgi:exoribonuclease-2
VYENDSAPIIGVVQGISQQGVAVLNQFGGRVNLPPIRLHRLASGFQLQQEKSEARAEELRSLLVVATNKAESIMLAEVWELVKSEGRKLTIRELAELAFGKVETIGYLALFLKLAKDKVFFRRTQFEFEPREVEAVQQLLRAQEVADARSREIGRIVSELQRTKQGLSALSANDREQLLHGNTAVSATCQLLARIACESAHINPAQQREAREVIDLLSATPEFSEIHGGSKNSTAGRGGRTESDAVLAYRILESLGLFDLRTDPVIYRHRWLFDAEGGFSEQQYQVNLDCEREDLTSLYSFTIDDQKTHDMDDALSVVWEADRILVGVHISDLTSQVPINSQVDRIASQRGTSIYLPERVYNMLPTKLATDAASLLPEAIRPTISCIFEYTRTQVLVSKRIVRSKIRSAAKVTYDEVDRLLEGDNTLRDLPWAAAVEFVSQVGARNEDLRIANGAQKISKRDLNIDVDQAGQVILREFDESSPARALVAEMAVMANAAFAKFAADNQLPFIFRSQAPGEDPQASDLPEGPARAYAERSNLKKSVVSVDPAPHASLGLSVYAQVTSPIRRFVDLCNQRQIVAHLTSTMLPYQRQDLEKIVEALNEPLGVANTISRDGRRYWLLRYLEQSLDREHHGIVIRTDLKNPLVEFIDIPFTAVVKSNGAVKPGDRVKLNIQKIDAWADQLKIEAVKVV